MKRLAIVILSLVTAFASFAPAQALPAIAALNMPAAQPANIQRVRDRKYNRHRGWNGNRHHGWNSNRRNYRYNRYRHHDNRAGAIIGGLAAGAIIGGVLSSAARSNAGASAHTQRCYARYRSYRASDNTFQPYSGPRQRCVL